MIADLIKANRSCRRFDESHPVPATLLMEWVDLARLSASAANLQPLKYEEIVIEPLNDDGDIRYWRSADRIHHVPKRSLEEMIVARF